MPPLKPPEQDPDAYDYEDCRPGPSTYPKANEEATTPPHIKALLEERAGKKDTSKS